MKKQTALLLSTLVLLSAVSMQPAHAFKLKFWEKKSEAVIAQSVKKECPCKGKCKCHKHKFWEKKAKVEAPKKEEVKVAPAAKPACPAAKPAVKPAAPVTKPGCPAAKPAAKAPVKK